MGGFAPPPMGPRRASSIADLILRRGDIQAQRTRQSGAHWADTLSQMGQIVGAGMQDADDRQAATAEQAATTKRGEALAALVSSPPSDPQEYLAESVRILGPDEGAQFAKESQAYRMTAEKAKNGEAPTLDEFKYTLQGVGRLWRENPEAVKAGWASIQPALAPGAREYWKIDLENTWRDDYGQAMDMFLPDEKAPGTRQVKTRNPDGSESIQIVEDEPGQTFESAAPQPPPRVPTNVIESEAAARARGTASARPPDTGPDPEMISAYVDDLDAGMKIWSDVPGSVRNAVQVAARDRGVSMPTKRPKEATINELSEAQGLIDRTADLLSLPTGVEEWAKATAIPDWVTQMTGWGAAAKANKSDFFMYMAATLKAIQGSRPSDRDMQWYMENLPRQGESPQSAQIKINRIRKRLTDTYNRRVRGLRRNGYALLGYGEIQGGMEGEGLENSAGWEDVNIDIPGVSVRRRAR